MDLSALFTLALSLDFTVYFSYNNEPYQDYFIFDGDSSQAHMFRNNETIYLRLSEGSDWANYQFNSSFSVIEFTWPYYINGQPMTIISDDVYIANSSYHSFVFLDPLPIQTILYSYTQTSKLVDTKFNYEYIIGIVVALLILIRSPELINLVIARYQARHQLITQETEV